jgi:hypothetical protein
MAVVGLHRLPNVGIDYGHPLPDMIPTATAIVLMPKAGYVDDKDYGNTILYTGKLFLWSCSNMVSLHLFNLRVRKL